MKSFLGGMFLAIAVGVYALAVANTAWVSDDAYISYRAVDNLLHGYGLTWNVDERVQAFTNPLWVLLNAAAACLNSLPWHIFISGLMLSFVVSLLAVTVLSLGVARSVAAGVFAVITLTFCRSFVDFSTSGLENPLNHLLLAVFAWLMLRPRWTLPVLFGMSLCCGLSITNRMDTLLLYAPVLAYAWLAERSLRAGLVMALGFLPFVAWEAFALVYYGFPFPNTAYAKLGTGIPAAELAQQGLWYLWNTAAEDRAAALVLIAGLLIAPLALRKGQWTALALGGLLYVAYVVRVGGDFMGGRFLSAPLMVAMLLLVQLPWRGGVAWGAATIAAVLLGLSTPYAPLFTGDDYGSEKVRWDAHRVADERWYFMQHGGLRFWDRATSYPDHPWAQAGKKHRGNDRYASIKVGACGFIGYFGGPKFHAVDYFALVDPLIARLPALHDPAWRIGHFVRYVPKWYLQMHADAAKARQKDAHGAGLDWSETAEQGLLPVVPQVPPLTPGERPDADTDPDLMQYYQALSTLVHGPIWRWERFRVMLDMNLGRYEHLIHRDVYRFPRLATVGLSQVAPALDAAGTPSVAATLDIPMSGIEVRCERAQHNGVVEFSAGDGGDYRVVFMRGGEEVGHADARAGVKSGRLGVFTCAAPSAAVSAGYDAVRVVPYHGGRRVFGYFRLL